MAASEMRNLSGRVVRVEKKYANIQVSAYGQARLDIYVARRIIGSHMDSLRDILTEDARVIVAIKPLSDETLSKIPPQFRRKETFGTSWEVIFFKKDVPPIPPTALYPTPATYFADLGRPGPVPDELLSRVVSALYQITAILDNTDLKTVLALLKKHFKVRDIPDINIYLADQNGFVRFIHSQPQYFSVSGGNLRRSSGFTEEIFNAAITRKAQEVYTHLSMPASRSRTPLGRVAAANAAPDDPDITKDVINRIDIINAEEDSRRVLGPILDQSSRQSVIVGLDCEGVHLGRDTGSLTLVQVATIEGKAFLFDVFRNPHLLRADSSLKKLLQHRGILKVIHDCKSDTSALFHEFEVSLQNVFDTSIAMRTIMEQLNRFSSYRISFKDLCELLGEGVSHKEEAFVQKMIETPDFWKIRPFSEEMLYYAASDALCLVPGVYKKLDGMLTPIWRKYFTWSCEDTLRSNQRPKQQSTRPGTSGSRPSRGRRGTGRSSRGDQRH